MMKISAKFLTKVYKNGIYALDGFSAEIESGDFVTILGESGSGKSTLLRLLSGLDKPTCGELYFDGVLTTDMPIKYRDTAVVFQEYVLYPKMTVWENVAAALKRYDLPREEEEKRIYKVLKDFGLYTVRNQLPKSISGGQQQRTALARAVVRQPSLILFDEPLSNIAEEQRSDYMQLITDLKQKLPKTTFIYVTHNLREAVLLGKKLLIMQNGKVLQFGEKQFIWKNPYCAEVLRTFANCEEERAKVKDGIVTTESGKHFKTDCTDGDVIVIYNAYDNKEPYLFDKKGENLQGERRFCELDANFDGQTLSFGKVNVKVSDEYRARYFGAFGAVTVKIESRNLRINALHDDIKIPAVHLGGSEYSICNRKVTLLNKENFDGAFYVNLNDIFIFNGERRYLANYKIYKSKSCGKVVDGGIRLPAGELYCNVRGGKVEVMIDSKAFASPVKKGKRGGLKAECIAEENLGNCLLAYFAIKGFDNYVAVCASSDTHFFAVKRLKIEVRPEGILVRKLTK